ncbi:hypothetical protein ACIQCF_07345 [Streptomyces sp. NPDC088353]|uniref:hypothetical protein n=1 Tax=Streptomyces sp. NPDC088353 TaxID=3365855 RepID=UPI00380EF778
MPRRHRPAPPLGLGSPLGRWGFTICALVALANGLQLPCLICTAIAIYAWRSR